MKFTGERFIPTEQGRIRLEHYHRYAMVLDMVKKKAVLDVACGEGYGSFLMADVAHTVIGVDISDEAVRHASSVYNKPNLKFLHGSATNLVFPDDLFDVVVSFETIEHLAEQEQMLAEIRRVLRPNGALVISSPNRPIYSEESGDHNEFHVKELDFQEFDNLIRSKFLVIEYFGQRLLMSSVIQPLTATPNTSSVWSDNGSKLNDNAAILKDPVYFVAVCGSTSASMPNLGMSALYPASMDLVKHYVGFAKWAKSLEKIVTERDTQIASLSQAVTERDGQIASLTDEDVRRSEWAPQLIASLSQAVTERDGQIASLSQAVTERDGQIASLTNENVRRSEWALRLDAELKEERAKVLALTTSHSWHITRPLREAKRWVSSPKTQVKRYAKAALKFAKRMYQSLPLSPQTKAMHRHWIAKVFPRILLASGAHPSTIPALNTVQPLISQIANQENFKSLGSPPYLTTEILIPSSDNPLVSVIIPIYGKVDYTLRCMASIAANPPLAAFEVIVVDDCSPDDSWNVLSEVKNIHLFQNEQNQGFIRSCNIGAQAAKGQYLHFLNNDTEVTPGWLDELLRTFSEFPGTGLAGSKLIYPDGRLQEAGGIIWQNGSAWNFGRFQDPNFPVYNYAREVDYCSGASIMVPKSLFDELGGFDEHYLPAYCEDSDIALKIRDSGYRVIYQPLSTVIHHEGITSGTDITQGAKAYQVENSKKLFERWQRHLQTHQAHGVDVDNAKDRKATRRALVIDHCTPTPNQDAGSVTVFNLLLLLREMEFQVTFIPEDNFLYMPEYTTALQRNGIEVLYGSPFFTSVEQHLKEHGERYDLAFLFRPGVVDRHLKAIRKHCARAKVLYHTVDLHFLRMAREAVLQKDKSKERAAQEMRQRELTAIQAADASIVHSTAELDILHPLLPEAKLHVFPLIMDVKGTTKGFAERKDIVFVGGYQHTPNVDAVQYFVKDVMPLLRKLLPGVRFYAVGSKTPTEIQVLASEDVIVTGFIEDLTPLLDKMRVSVAPLRYGAGIKGKIGTAMAVGLPVVATSLAAEGMSLTDGENILSADGAEAFATTIAKIYNDEALWNHISQNGLAFADNVWGTKAAWSILATILADLGIQVKRGPHTLSLYSEPVPPPGNNRNQLLPMGSINLNSALTPADLAGFL